MQGLKTLIPALLTATLAVLTATSVGEGLRPAYKLVGAGLRPALLDGASMSAVPDAGGSETRPYGQVRMVGNPGSGPAKELDCARCHQNPVMAPSLKDSLGVPRSLYIDPAAFAQSYHFKVGKKTQCVLCHEDVKTFPHQRTKALACLDCHPDDKKPIFRAITADLRESVHKNLDCNSCHDVHRNQPAAEMTLAEKNQGCLKCHEYGLSSARYPALEPTPIAALHTWHPQAQLHLDRMACVVCHTDLAHGNASEAAAEAGKHLIRDKTHATRACAACHRPDSKTARYLIDLGADQGGQDPGRVLQRIYLVGGTRAPWIEWGGSALVLLALAGTVGHGAGRAAIARRKK